MEQPPFGLRSFDKANGGRRQGNPAGVLRTALTATAACPQNLGSGRRTEPKDAPEQRRITGRTLLTQNRGHYQTDGFSLVALALTLLSAFSLIYGLPDYLIFKKAGYSGVLGLGMLVPGVNVVLVFWFAFSEWPIHRQLKKLRAP